MQVRDPVHDDADVLGEIHVRAWQTAYRGGLMPDAYLDGLSVDERADMWRAALSRAPRPGMARLVSEDDGEVGGFIAVGPANGDADCGEVYALNVHPERWGEGHGQALLDAGVRALADAGFAEAILWVVPGNLRARRFYERAGWRDDAAAREQEVFGVAVPEVRYRRALPSAVAGAEVR